jgi:hypothetical protein
MGFESRVHLGPLCLGIVYQSSDNDPNECNIVHDWEDIEMHSSSAIQYRQLRVKRGYM